MTLRERLGLPLFSEGDRVLRGDYGTVTYRVVSVQSDPERGNIYTVSTLRRDPKTGRTTGRTLTGVSEGYLRKDPSCPKP